MPSFEETRLNLLKSVQDWPTQPGIYIMRDAAKRILYVGKAKNLRNRIRSYFQKQEQLTGKTIVLVRRIISLEFQTTTTELEALLLECNLIKKHKPRYNIRLKDDKNYPYVVLDFTHPFPQFIITRKVIPSPKLRYFGPFSGGIRDLSRFILKTFQLRDCSDSKFKNRTRPCLNYEIGTCTAPCVNYVTEEQYNEQIQEALLFLKGKKKELLKKFETEMTKASADTKYELAKSYRDKIRAIQHLTEKQSAVLADKLKDIDVIGVYEAEGELCFAVLFLRSGQLTGRRIEKTPLILDSKEKTVEQFLEQFYSISLIPEEIWLAEDFKEREMIQAFLSKQAKRTTAIKIPRTEKPLRLLGMAYENAKLVYLEDKKKTGETHSEALRKVLDLSDAPQSIEGIDVSNFQGKEPSVALVHFSDEKPLKSRYRTYHPKTIEGQNDFGMIYETLTRRLKSEDNPPPDLFLIDGGKGQLQAAVRALTEAGAEIPVCALAKARTESSFTRKEIERSEERIFVPNRKNPIVLKEGHPALQLLQRVRDEAHRFSVKGHRIRRHKQTFEASSLVDIKGIGPKLREKLLISFGSLEGILSASDESLREQGASQSVILSLRKLSK